MTTSTVTPALAGRPTIGSSSLFLLLLFFLITAIAHFPAASAQVCSVNRGFGSGNWLEVSEEADFPVVADAQTICRVSCDSGGFTFLYLRYGGEPGLIFYDGYGESTICQLSVQISSDDDERTLGYWLEVEGSYTNLRMNCTCTQAGQSEFGCFSGDTVVSVEGRGDIPMRQLQIGDRVLTQTTYQTVYSFGHYQPNHIQKFYQIYTNQKDNHHKSKQQKAAIELTGNHFLYNQEGTPVRADQLIVGDTLWGGTTVTNIKQQYKQGVYLPLTADGTIIVGHGNQNVLASNYVSLEHYFPNTVQTSKYYIADEPTGFQYFMAPFRMFCMGMSMFAHEEFCNARNPETGILEWLHVGIRIAQFGERQPLWIQHALGLPLTIGFGLLYQLEQRLGGPQRAPSVLLTLSLLLIILGLGVGISKQRRRNRREKGTVTDTEMTPSSVSAISKKIV